MKDLTPSEGQEFVRKVNQLMLLISKMDLLVPWDRIVSSISDEEPRMLRDLKAQSAAETLKTFRGLMSEIDEFIDSHQNLNSEYASRLFELNDTIIEISNNMWLIYETKGKDRPPIMTTGLCDAISKAERAIGIGHAYDVDDEVEIMGVPGVRDDFVGKYGTIVSVRRIKAYERSPLNLDRYQYSIQCADGRERHISKDAHLRLIKKGHIT